MKPPGTLRAAAWRWLAAALLCAGLTTHLEAQDTTRAPVDSAVPAGIDLPTPANLTPEQAQAILRARPDLAQQLRERINASGLTPDQIRARLRAQGYPEDLLDDYLGGAAAVPEGAPSSNILTALRSLGVVSADEADSLRALRDSTAGLADSLTPGRKAPARLKVFGVDVFQRRSREFAPALAGPIDPSYVLGPGDVLVLLLTGDVERAHTLEVTREGFIFIPQVGQVFVANETLGQVTDQLYARLGRVYSGVRKGPNATTRFQLSVSKVRSVQVYVAGEVARPGLYAVSGSGTVLSALYAAGGPTENGSFRRVEVRRGTELLGTVDLYDYLLRGINSSSIRLASGDVVFVPTYGPRAKVTGEIVRPAIYELKPGETLRELVSAAGGFRETALTSRVQIHRILPPAGRGEGGRDRVVVDVSGEAMKSGALPGYPMEGGDSVVVFAVAERSRAVVVVKGNVWLEGPVGFTPGMTLSDALRLAGGPKPDVFLGDVLVSRLQPDSSRIQLRSALADSTGRPVDNLVLAEDDEVIVFSRTDFRSDRYVTIAGAVRKPGRLTFNDGMTIRDAILLADGLREDAYLSSAEVARLPTDRAGGQVATTIRVPLDSTYIFDRDRDGRYIGPPGLPAPASGAPTFRLEAFDNVLILQQPQWELQRTVTLTGQVQFPGRYALVTRTERLSDLLVRAGGVTKEAYPAGVEFYRSGEGRIGVDLPKVLSDPSFNDNIILAGGDSIHIPEYSPVVAVRGAVNAPLNVTYVPGKRLDFYVNAAGGYSRDADIARTYVLQPTGKVESVKRRFLLADGKPTPLAGATIEVPAKDKSRPPSNVLPLLGTLATVLASLATVVIVARQ
jgi:protein involved in polysaccharide export with SLBB domain